MISCTLGDDGVPSYEDTCTFTCNTGYELTGNDTRTCQNNGSWSGSDVVCRRSELFLVYICVHHGSVRCCEKYFYEGSKGSSIAIAIIH